MDITGDAEYAPYFAHTLYLTDQLFINRHLLLIHMFMTYLDPHVNSNVYFSTRLSNPLELSF